MLKKMSKFLVFLIIGLLLYLGVLYFIQDKLIFYPDKVYINPNQAKLSEFQEIPLVMSDGTLVMSWYAKGKENKPIILFFHGNSGQIATFAPLLKSYYQEGYSIFMPEYRGFAKSGGKLTEENMYADAVSSFDFVKENLKQNKIIVFGYSMGTAPASFLAKTRQPTALILAAPFLSLVEEVKDKPIPLASWVLKNRLDSEKYIAEYKNPLLVIHGTQDKLILPYHGEKMFKLALTKDKCLKFVKNVDHNRLFFDEKNHSIIQKWLTEVLSK